MGFDNARIILDNPNNTYYAGQTVQGKFTLERDRVKSFRGIYVCMRGYCKVHWTTEHTRRVNDRDESYTVNHDSYEEYFDQKIYLMGGAHGNFQLNPGRHEFQFNFHIPPNCPSSFEGKHGHVRYDLKVVVDRPFKTDQEISRQLKVIAPLDLNSIAGARDPLVLELNDSYCCCCISSGSSQTLVKMPVSGFCPGQVVPVEVSCKNTSTVDLEHIKLAIKKDVKYRAIDNPDTKDEDEVIAVVQRGPIPANTTKNWTIEMEVPIIDVVNMKTCTFITVSYEFKVTVVTEGCHDDSDESCNIIFGTVPLVGYQDNIKSVQPVAPPDTIQSYPPTNTPYPAPIVNQPVATGPPYPGAPYPVNQYPTNSPYPAPNQPHPGYPPNQPNVGFQPFPNENQPNTGSPNPGSQPVSQYPNPSPYPSNQPYPGAPGQQLPPYPTGVQNQPHLGASDPQPNPYPSGGQNPPYPGAPSQQDPPYPSSGQNPPYPGAPSQQSPPYPTSVQNQSYPGAPGQQPSPYPSSDPPRQTTTALRTGTFGFMAQGDTKGPESVPLLPPGAQIPYPLNSGVPYPPAGNETDQHQPQPPYNPNFTGEN